MTEELTGATYEECMNFLSKKYGRKNLIYDNSRGVSPMIRIKLNKKQLKKQWGSFIAVNNNDEIDLELTAKFMQKNLSTIVAKQNEYGLWDTHIYDEQLFIQV